MSRHWAEILMGVFVGIRAELLTLIAGVLRTVMEDLDEDRFRHALESLDRHSAVLMNRVLMSGP